MRVVHTMGREGATHHNKIKTAGDFESANQITAKNHNIGEREAPYKRSNNDLTNSC